MTAWKILIADDLAEEGIAILNQEAEAANLAGISAEDLIKEIPPYDALIVRGRTKVSKAVIEAAENLKVIGRAGVGVDNIDLAAAQGRKLVVVNAPLAGTNAVAEHAISLMLALMRRVTQADTSMKAGLWEKKTFKGLEMSGRTLGIIGLGRIGKRTAELASSFGMRVIAHDPYKAEEYFKETHADGVDLNTLYQQADVISLHLPFNRETHNLLNGEAFAYMKRGVLVINTARGGIIDETALLARLETGQVAGVALDVFENEPPGLTALVAHKNVIATPHIGAQTVEAQRRAAEQIAAEVLQALKGEALRWQIV